MGFWTAVIIIVSIMAGSSVVTGIISAFKPKIRQKDLDQIKAEIKGELTGGDNAVAIPDQRDLSKRLRHLEDKVDAQDDEIQHLSEENTFLRRLLDKD